MFLTRNRFVLSLSELSFLSWRLLLVVYLIVLALVSSGCITSSPEDGLSMASPHHLAIFLNIGVVLQ